MWQTGSKAYESGRFSFCTSQSELPLEKENKSEGCHFVVSAKENLKNVNPVQSPQFSANILQLHLFLICLVQHVPSGDKYVFLLERKFLYGIMDRRTLRARKAQLAQVRAAASTLLGRALLAPTLRNLQASKHQVPAELPHLQQNISSAFCLLNGLENVA